MLSVVELLFPNERVLRERWNKLHSLIQGAPEVLFEKRTGPDPSLAIEGIQLSSAEDSAAEAALQVARVPPHAKSATIYGVGLGGTARALLARETLDYLQIVVLNTSVAKVLFSNVDCVDWLSDSRVELVTLPGSRELSLPFAAIPACLQLADDKHMALRDAVGLKLQEPYLATKWRERENEVGVLVAANRELVSKDRDVGEVFGSLLGGRCYVVGPGPTLTAAIDELKDRPSGALLVAISTALSPLLQVGLVPDYVVMIDFHSITPFDDDQASHLTGVPLVYVPDVQHATLAAWPGPRLCGYLKRIRHDSMAKQFPRASLWTEGTVAHCAVDFAVQLGASELVLAGLDFAYPGGASHAEGTPDFQPLESADMGRTLIDGFGNRVRSDPNLITYLRDLENYIADHTDVSFLRMDRRGAEMEGAQWI